VTRIVFTVLTASILFGQVTSPPPIAQPQQSLPPPRQSAPEVKPEDKCSIEGQVIDAITGEPLKKAELTLRGANMPGTPYGAVSDAGGKFVIGDIDPGEYRLSANRNGFVHQEYGAHGNGIPGRILALSASDKLTGLVFKMMPQAVITGHVLDEDGDPVARVRVEALQYRYMRGRKQLLPAGLASTDDLGEYRIFGLRAGKYLLRATYRSSMGLTTAVGRDSVNGNRSDSEEGYAPVYYPGATESSGAAPLNLVPGAEMRGADIRLMKTRTVRIRGRVIAPTGRGRQESMVVLMPREEGAVFQPGGRMMSSTDAQGRFEMHGITPGSYVLAAVWGNEGRYSGHQQIDVGASDIDDIQVNLIPPADLSAQVKVEGNAQVQLDQVHVALTPATPGAMGGSYATADVDGNLTFKNVAPGSYQPTVSVPPGLYVKSIRHGDTDAIESGIDVSQGAGGLLQITLSAAGAQVDGSVTTDKGEPSTGATVTLVPGGPRRMSSMFFKTANTDQSGRFSFKDVAPGEYKVYAWDQIDAGAAQDPDFVKPFDNNAKEVKLEEGARENLDLKLIQVPADAAQ